MAQQRAVPPRLSLSHPQPQLSKSTTARFYPVFTPTSSNNALMFSPSTTPTPSKGSRAPQGPLWLFTSLHLLSLYLLHQWLAASPMPPPLVIFAFFPLFMAALCLNITYRPWKGRQILPSQWGLLLISSAFLGLSYFLCFQGLQLSGPLETIFADFAGSLVVKVLLDSSNKSSETARKARGLIAVLLGVFFLSHGWARISCSPLAVDVSYTTRIKITNQSEDCVKLWSVLAPFLGGVLSALHKMIGAKSSLKSIGKKRVQVLCYAMGSVVLFPVALFQLALVAGQSNVHYGLSFWSVATAVAFGMIVLFFSDFYKEEKLFMPSHSLKAFQILACVVCGLELLYGLGISLAGFLFCSLVLGIGVQELGLLQGQLSWEELGDTSYGSLVFASWIKRPLQHIMSDKKSRKIAIFLLINTGFMFVEFFYGFLSNSLGLISDACHMLFDCAALAIGLYASYISRLPENSKFNYGYGRVEVVSGYANAVLLVLVASLIVLESIERILEPPEISTESLLVVSVGGLLVNIVGLIFFHEEHHHAHGHGVHSCSHSHSSLKPLHSSESTLIDTKVAITSDGSSYSPFFTSDGSFHSPFPSGYQSFNTQDNGNGVATSGAEQGHHKSQDYSHKNHLHHHGAHAVCHHEHDHHDCQGHSPQNSSSYCQMHGFEQEGHDHHDGKYQHKESHQYRSEHNLSHHHHNHDSHSHHNHGHASPHQEPSDHLHACSSGHLHHHSEGHDGHLHHHSEGHDCVNHTEQQNHGNKDVGHDNLHHDHNHEHHHNHVHHDDNDNHSHDHHHHMDHNMYGIFLHVLADTLGSIGVVVSTLLIKYKGWLITDPACSIFLSALIIGSVVPLLRNSAEILLQRVPRHNEKSVKTAMKQVGGLAGVQSVGRAHVWSFTNTEIVGSLHVQLSAGSNRKFVQEKTLRILHEAGIGDLTLQIEEAS